MLKGHKIEFNIYAESGDEAEEGRRAIVGFIDALAKQGRAVSGKKIAEAVARWDKNPFVKSKILEFFK